jgi:hypothetical protein
MKTYKVRAKRWAHGWELRIDGVGVTRSHSLVTPRGWPVTTSHSTPV